MSYVLKGNLCGSLCDDCREPLAGATVRLFRAQQTERLAAAAVADVKETFALLSAEEAAAKIGDRLIGEGTVDALGNFAVEIDDDRYDGEAFEIDLELADVPHHKPARKPRPPVQLSLTTLAPRWRGGDGESVAVWSHCIPQRLWCNIRARFDAWVICGRVVSCESGVPLAGLTVSAFDADWLQDDAIGSAVTAGDGHFRIDYTSADFEKTPFSPVINIEFVAGPDLYFKIHAAGGALLLDEQQPDGFVKPRKNVGHCFCVKLCAGQDDPPFHDPYFTHIGSFDVLSDIDSTTGLTTIGRPGHGGLGYGFFGRLDLKGFCPKTRVGAPGLAMRYRFLYEHPANPGTEVPITGAALVGEVIAGSRLVQWDITGAGLVWTQQTIKVAATGATVSPPPPPPFPPGTPWGPVPEHVIVPDADGWVVVDPFGLDDGFYGPLLQFTSAGAVAGGSPLVVGDRASVPAVSPKNGAVIKLIYEARPVAPAEPRTARQVVQAVFVNNWATELLLDLEEFHSGPTANACSPLGSALHVEYTVDHEMLAAYNVSVLSASFGVGPNPPNPSPLRSGAVPRGNAELPAFFNISTWGSCSYTVILSSSVKLTDGNLPQSSDERRLTFCK